MVGVANDQATWTEIIIVTLIALVLIAISAGMAYYEHIQQIDWYYMEFVAPNGQYKRVRARTLAGKSRAIRDYTKLGYTLYAEGEVTK
jgi:uncharacterized protein YxeA